MPTPTYIPLGTITITGSPTEVQFNSIAQSYRDLILVGDFSTNTTSDMPGIRFNGDSGANYNTVIMLGSGTSAFSYSRTGRTSGWMEWYSASGKQLIECSIMDYSVTDKHKTVLFRRDQAGNVTSAGAIRWANTAAITSISIIPAAETGSGAFNSGSTFSLFGIVS